MNEVSLGDRGCARRRGVRSIPAIAALAAVLVSFPPVGGLAASSSPPAVPALTLRSTDRCFFAPAVPGSGVWPLQPLGAAHPIRGSFNEPRGSSPHFGVDIQALRDRAPVYAMAPGTIIGLSRPGGHFSIGESGAYYSYWHVALLSRLAMGDWVGRGQLVGYVQHGFYHVHLSEYEGGCGWVDPRRPTGALHDRRDTEWPGIGPITAYAASGSAFTSDNTRLLPSLQHDPATRLAMDDLHGVVDFRADVTDMPDDRMRYQLQLPLEVAAIRAYMAPATDRFRMIGRLRHVYDGARLLHPAGGLWRVWAFGTYRVNLCYFSIHGRCGAAYVWHVGGRSGFNVAELANGRYQFCVQAITVNGERNHRCAPVVVNNP
ncbi:MAG: hypothetical protein ACTHNU_11100 [Gaiellales bacterium]